MVRLKICFLKQKLPKREGLSMYKKLSILILTGLAVTALEAKKTHKESSKTQTKSPTKVAAAKKAPINDDFSWITDQTKGIPGFSLGQEENLQAALEGLSPAELEALQQFLNQKTPQAVQAALSSTHAIPGVNDPELIKDLNDLNTQDIETLTSRINTPATPTNNNDDDVAVDLGWLFDPSLPIPGATQATNQPATQPATPTITTAEQIIAAYATLPATEQAQVTQSLLLNNQNNVTTLIANLSSSHEPVLPTSTNAAAQQYLSNLQSAFATLQNLIRDMLASPALRNVPIQTYLQNSLLELCASVSGDSASGG